MLKVLSNILCDLDPKVKVIGQKAGICDGVPSTSALVFFNIFCSEPNFRHAPSSTFLVCEHLCPWQDCADVQARLSLRWLHVREVP